MGYKYQNYKCRIKKDRFRILKTPFLSHRHTFPPSTSTRSHAEAHKSCPACRGANMETHSYSCWLMFYRFYHGGVSHRGSFASSPHGRERQSGGAVCSDCGTRLCVRGLATVLASADLCVFASHKHANLPLLTDQRKILCYIPHTVTPS